MLTHVRPSRLRIAFVAFVMLTGLLAPTISAPQRLLAAPTNDDLVDALTITDDYDAEIDSTDATLEIGEVSGSCELLSPDWSIWYWFNAPGSGNVRMKTQFLNSPNATNYIELFEVTSTGPITLGSEVGCTSGQNAATLVSAVTAGNYAIRIAGAASDLGDMVRLDFDTMGTISGTVTDENTTDPISGITVQVLTTSGTELLGSATTDVNGDYTADVPTDDVIVQFAAGSSAYGLEYWDDVLTAFDATVLEVTAITPITGIDAALTDAGTVEVTVTSSLGSVPLENAQIALYEEPTGSLGGPIYQGSTESDGTKTFIGVVPGNYIARIDHEDHLDEWYDDVDFWNLGTTTIVVTAGNTSAFSAELAAGGKVSGTVTDDGGDPIEGATVEAYRTSDGSLAYNEDTDETGAYEMPGMEPDTYAIRVQTDNLDGTHASEWWDDLPDSTGYAAADHIIVDAGANETADFSIVASSVSGTVTSAGDGLPIGNVAVTLFNDDDSEIASTSTAADGTYAFEAFGFTGTHVYVGFDAAPMPWVAENSAPQAFVAGDSLVVNADLVVDQADPVITGGTLFSVSEDASVGTAVGTVTATDANRADELSFAITGGNTGTAFAISTGGTITTAAALDFETTESYSLTVEVSDDNGGSTSGTVTVDVTDVDDGPTEIPSAGFIDTIGTTFEAEIDWMAFEGITLGCNPPDNNMYCPGDNVTRGQMAAFIVRALNLPAASQDYFDDDNGSTFEDNINRLAEAEITKGCSVADPTLYCPNDTVTRGQMAAFIVRAMGYTDDGGGDLFDDDDGSTFESDIDKLATAGVTLGCNPPDNNHYCPADTITRGQMAAFLFRALAE